MELKTYFNALLRRWPIVVALPLLALVFGVYQEATRTPTWTTDVQARVLFDSTSPPTDDFDFNRFYQFGSTEYAIDDLVEVLHGNVFAEGVAERLSDPTVTTTDVEQALGMERRHRVLTITVTAGDHDRAVNIASAAATELEENASALLGLNQIESEALIEIVDRPVDAMSDAARARLLIILQVLAAAGAGVILAFLIDYLDDTLYDRDSVAAALRLPHLASVPSERRG